MENKSIEDDLFANLIRDLAATCKPGESIRAGDMTGKNTVEYKINAPIVFRIGDRVEHVASQREGVIIDVGKYLHVEYDNGSVSRYDDIWFGMHPNGLKRVKG